MKKVHAGFETTGPQLTDLLASAEPLSPSSSSPSSSSSSPGDGKKQQQKPLFSPVSKTDDAAIGGTSGLRTFFGSFPGYYEKQGDEREGDQEDHNEGDHKRRERKEVKEVKQQMDERSSAMRRLLCWFADSVEIGRARWLEKYVEWVREEAEIEAEIGRIEKKERKAMELAAKLREEERIRARDEENKKKEEEGKKKKEEEEKKGRAEKAEKAKQAKRTKEEQKKELDTPYGQRSNAAEAREETKSWQVKPFGGLFYGEGEEDGEEEDHAEESGGEAEEEPKELDDENKGEKSGTGSEEEGKKVKEERGERREKEEEREREKTNEAILQEMAAMQRTAQLRKPALPVHRQPVRQELTPAEKMKILALKAPLRFIPREWFEGVLLQG